MWDEAAQSALEKLAAEGLAARDIGAALGFSKNAVIGRARRTSVKLRDLPISQHDQRTQAEVRRLYLRGDSYDQIAKQTGVPRLSVAGMTRGLPRRLSHPSSALYRPKRTKVRAITRVLLGEKKPRVAASLGIPVWVLRSWRCEEAVVSEAASIVHRIKRLRAAAAEAAIRSERERRRGLVMAASSVLTGRKLDIASRLIDGQSSTFIGEVHGVSGERIRQIKKDILLAGVRL